MMNRSAKDGARSSLHYGGEGVLTHPSDQGVCGRHGMEDLDVTPGGLVGFPGGTGENGPYKSRDEMGKEARRAIGQPNTTASATKAVRLRKQRPGGPGQSVGEGGWRESLKE